MRFNHVRCCILFRAFGMRKLAIYITLAIVTLCRLANAQGLARLGGIISDPSGAAILSATVTATEVETGSTRSVVTGSDGHYAFVRASEKVG